MNRIRLLLIVASIAFGLAGVNAQIVVRTFDEDAIGSPPPNLTFAVARQQTAGKWLVRAEGPNHYMTHLADSAAAGGFSLAVLDTPHPAHMRASVKLKLLDG